MSQLMTEHLAICISAPDGIKKLRELCPSIVPNLDKSKTLMKYPLDIPIINPWFN
jgi:hypothetical protein